MLNRVFIPGRGANKGAASPSSPTGSTYNTSMVEKKTDCGVPYSHWWMEGCRVLGNGHRSGCTTTAQLHTVHKPPQRNGLVSLACSIQDSHMPRLWMESFKVLGNVGTITVHNSTVLNIMYITHYSAFLISLYLLTWFNCAMRNGLVYLPCSIQDGCVPCLKSISHTV